MISTSSLENFLNMLCEFKVNLIILGGSQLTTSWPLKNLIITQVRIAIHARMRFIINMCTHAG